MGLWILPKIMTCIVLINSNRLVVCTGSSKATTPTSTDQTGSKPKTGSTPSSIPQPAIPTQAQDSHTEDSKDKENIVESQDSKVPNIKESESNTFKEISLSNITIITQDNSNGSKFIKNDTRKYDVKNENDVISYKFKDGIKCTEIKYKHASVWKYDRTKTTEGYPKSALFYLKTKVVMLHFKDLLYVYRHGGTKWKLIFCGKPNPIQLDIKKDEGSKEFDYTKDDSIATFASKGNVLFQEVIERKGSCSCGSDETIHQAANYSEYAYKVVRDGIGTFKSLENVSIYFLNGIVEKYKKIGCCSKQWNHISTKIYLPSDINLNIIMGSFIFNIIIKMKECETKAREEKLQLIKYPYEQSVSFIFNNQVTYFKLKHKTDQVFEYKDPEKEFPLGFKVQSSHIMVMLKDDKYKSFSYMEYGKKFNSVGSKSLTSNKDLNITFMGSENDDGTEARNRKITTIGGGDKVKELDISIDGKSKQLRCSKAKG